MSKLNQLLNIEVGTFKRQGNKLILELNHNQFRYDQLSELNELKQADAKFLQLVKIIKIKVRLKLASIQWSQNSLMS